jgi:hypothetical protein
MGDTFQKRTRTREGWTEEQKQAARERETQRRAQLQQQADDEVPRVPSGFVAFPAWMLPDRSISDLGKWVILALSLYASRDGLCWPTASTLANTLNRSERTVFRGLNEVVALGLVSVVPRYRNGAQISSVYQLEFSRWGSIKPPPDKNVIPGESKLSSQGCQNRHAEQDPKTGSTQQVDPPYPPSGGKTTERAPRAEAVGKKAGEGKARGPRPRMIALRDELLQRIRKSKTAGAADLICPPLEPILLDAEWRTLIPATVDESTLREAMELLPPQVFTEAGVSISAALDYARGKRLELDSWHEALEADVVRAYEAGTLRAEWRARLARAGM